MICRVPTTENTIIGSFLDDRFVVADFKFALAMFAGNRVCHVT